MNINKRFLACFYAVLLSFLLCNNSMAQWTYGTTGLLNMPTAYVNDSGTFMLGGSYLNKHTSSSRWFYDTYNYYFNVTLFSCLEFSYNLELHKGVYDDYGCGVKGFWLPSTYGKFCNQDRQFSVKLRLWKEGWLYDWTPQVCIGSDDITSHSWYDPDKQFALEDSKSNGFNNRYYAAVTKHFQIGTIGQIGAHVSYLFNIRTDYHLNAPSFGANFKFGLPSQTKINTLLNGLNILAEAYPAAGQGFIYDNSYIKQSGLGRAAHCGIYDLNIGAEYTIVLLREKSIPIEKRTERDREDERNRFLSAWYHFTDKVNSSFIGRDWQSNSSTSKTELKLYTELYGCKYPSAGIQLSVSL